MKINSDVGNTRRLSGRGQEAKRPIKATVPPSTVGKSTGQQMTVKIRPFHPDDEPAVIRLWSDCGLVVPSNDPARDIRRKLAAQPELLLVAADNDRIVGTVMAGYDGHRGWINYLAVDPQYRHRGIAGQMLAEAEKRLRAMGCPKINLQVRTSNRDVIAFYEHLGFRPDNVVSLGKRLVSDERQSPNALDG